MQINGAAARLANVGDKVIVASYADYDERELETYAPVVVHVDEDNRAIAVDSNPEVLLAAGARARWRHEHAPRASRTRPPDERPKMTLPRLAEMKRLGEPIAMVTAYDFPSAQVVEEAGVDLVLVGDSGAMTVLGHDSTVPVGMDEMLMLAAAVRRGLKTPLLVGDMPFGSYEASNEQAIANAQRFIKEAGCDAVKLERGGASVDRARAIVRAGIPVMGHVGLTPADRHRARRLQGAGPDRRARLADRRGRLRAAGRRLLRDRLRGGPGRASPRRSCRSMEVPVIGIGAGGSTDGQVLVFHDLLGINTGHTARFVKRYAGIHEAMVDGRRRLRRRRPRAPLPRGEPHLLDRPRRARRLRRLPRPGHPGGEAKWDW